jgi:hypothetical protein
VWAGIFAYFIALGAINNHVQKGLLLAGLASTALLHGLYDSFSDSWVGVVVAVHSIVIFVAYNRSGEVLQAKITALLHETAASPSARLEMDQTCRDRQDAINIIVLSKEKIG